MTGYVGITELKRSSLTTHRTNYFTEQLKVLLCIGLNDDDDDDDDDDDGGGGDAAAVDNDDNNNDDYKNGYLNGNVKKHTA